MAKLYYIQYIHVCFLSMFHSVAGAGAAEKRGGAGEHPGVRQDEEQPAPDQAGDRRRGADHLKKTTTATTTATTTTTREGVWVWLIMRVFVGTETSGKCVCVCVRAEESVCMWWRRRRRRTPWLSRPAVPSFGEERLYRVKSTLLSTR